ncbi:MAG: isocitrate lyase/PEP mutase family protein [Alphaproteobacteria bacterium]|nr:isocitrate lyase/PEP mutase family protein [Alphaproteobacteria bacterium]
MAETYAEAVRRKRLKFREILGRKTMTVMPGGFGPVYARVAQAAGFECFFVAGSQVSGHLLGVPDSGIMGLRDIADHARHVAAQSDIPILLDADTGFGNVVNVDFTVRELIRTGVAGLQIEDQEAPKKSGTLPGRRCIPINDAVVKYRAATAARDETDPDFVICARCDILGAEGSTFDEAIERSVAYVEDGGVDFVWLNSVETREQIAEAAAKVPAPVLIIWGGGDPMPTWEEYEALGARIVLYPTLASSVGLQAAWHTLHDLKARGVEALRDVALTAQGSPYGRAELRRIMGFERIQEIEDRFLPDDQRRDYASTWGHVGMLARPHDGPGGEDEEEDGGEGGGKAGA